MIYAGAMLHAELFVMPGIMCKMHPSTSRFCLRKICVQILLLDEGLGIRDPINFPQDRLCGPMRASEPPTILALESGRFRTFDADLRRIPGVASLSDLPNPQGVSMHLF